LPALREDRRKNAFDIALHVGRPKAQHPDPLFFGPSIASGVALRIAAHLMHYADDFNR
jgi:hypothetical protein